MNGPGYLVAHDPATGLLVVTRNGMLAVDADGFLVTPTGMRVQGFAEPKQIENFVDIKRSENIAKIDAALWDEQERLKEALKPWLGEKNIFAGSARLVSAHDARGIPTANATTDPAAARRPYWRGRQKKFRNQK